MRSQYSLFLRCVFAVVLFCAVVVCASPPVPEAAAASPAEAAAAASPAAAAAGAAAASGATVPTYELINAEVANVSFTIGGGVNIVRVINTTLSRCVLTINVGAANPGQVEVNVTNVTLLSAVLVISASKVPEQLSRNDMRLRLLITNLQAAPGALAFQGAMPMGAVIRVRDSAIRVSTSNLTTVGLGSSEPVGVRFDFAEVRGGSLLRFDNLSVKMFNSISKPSSALSLGGLTAAQGSTIMFANSSIGSSSFWYPLNGQVEILQRSSFLVVQSSLTGSNGAQFNPIADQMSFIAFVDVSGSATQNGWLDLPGLQSGFSISGNSSLLLLRVNTGTSNALIYNMLPFQSGSVFAMSDCSNYQSNLGRVISWSVSGGSMVYARCNRVKDSFSTNYVNLTTFSQYSSADFALPQSATQLVNCSQCGPIASMCFAPNTNALVADSSAPGGCRCVCKSGFSGPQCAQCSNYCPLADACLPDEVPCAQTCADVTVASQCSQYYPMLCALQGSVCRPRCDFSYATLRTSFTINVQCNASITLYKTQIVEGAVVFIPLHDIVSSFAPPPPQGGASLASPPVLRVWIDKTSIFNRSSSLVLMGTTNLTAINAGSLYNSNATRPNFNMTVSVIATEMLVDGGQLTFGGQMPPGSYIHFLNSTFIAREFYNSFMTQTSNRPVALFLSALRLRNGSSLIFTDITARVGDAGTTYSPAALFYVQNGFNLVENSAFIIRNSSLSMGAAVAGSIFTANEIAMTDYSVFVLRGVNVSFPLQSPTEGMSLFYVETRFVLTYASSMALAFLDITACCGSGLYIALNLPSTITSANMYYHSWLSFDNCTTSATNTYLLGGGAQIGLSYGASASFTSNFMAGPGLGYASTTFSGVTSESDQPATLVNLRCNTGYRGGSTITYVSSSSDQLLHVVPCSSSQCSAQMSDPAIPAPGCATQPLTMNLTAPALYTRMTPAGSCGCVCNPSSWAQNWYACLPWAPPEVETPAPTPEPPTTPAPPTTLEPMTTATPMTTPAPATPAPTAAYIMTVTWQSMHRLVFSGTLWGAALSTSSKEADVRRALRTQLAGFIGTNESAIRIINMTVGSLIVVYNVSQTVNVLSVDPDVPLNDITTDATINARVRRGNYTQVQAVYRSASGNPSATFSVQSASTLQPLPWSGSSGSSSDVGAIVGPIVAVLAVIGIVAAVIHFRRKAGGGGGRGKPMNENQYGDHNHAAAVPMMTMMQEHRHHNDHLEL